MSVKGPSPRTRGKRVNGWLSFPLLGSIPAHAGETSTAEAVMLRTKVHPRARGGNGFSVWTFDQRMGPSPRTRGKREARSVPHQSPGSIPAHAGETPGRESSSGSTRVHPRARGGNRIGMGYSVRRAGPSPRTRGKQPPHGQDAYRQGSIPAHAGETPSPGPLLESRRVHPRARGGNADDRVGFLVRQGPSPRTRGKQGDSRHFPGKRGSIPAHAGETGSRHSRLVPRSIPAHAGETDHRRRWAEPRRKVHPRARGGNVICSALSPRIAWNPGPSPRTRGKPYIWYTDLLVPQIVGSAAPV